MSNMTQLNQHDDVQLLTDSPVLTKLASVFKLAQGPLWNPEGYLTLSDTALAKIFELYLIGVVHVPLYNSGGRCVLYKSLSELIGANDLALNNEANLTFCHYSNHIISRIKKAKNILQFCSSLDGNLFNRTNDIVVKSDGAIFFTDPPHGIKKQVLNPSIFQSHTSLYRFFDNQLSLLFTDLKYPHALCFSKDERYLFVSSNHPDEKIIYKYELSAEGEIMHKEIFAFINANGIKMDKDNNLYVATNDGVVILSPYGEKLALIKLNAMATNIAFGGDGESLLFITTPSAVFYLPVDRPLRREIKYTPVEKNKKVWIETEKVTYYMKPTVSKLLGLIKLFIYSFH